MAKDADYKRLHIFEWPMYLQLKFLRLNLKLQLSFESIMNGKKNKCHVESDRNVACEIPGLMLSYN